ncbi:MAG TPA: fumarylacetoacetate hydrolase family protein [Pyrinomonadaceae bacterium]
MGMILHVGDRATSQSMTLEPGDVIATGTPPGVGFARNPPVFLKPGDRMEVLIEGMGGLGNPVVADKHGINPDLSAVIRG